MTRRGQRARSVAALITFGLLALATLVGSDDWFPFAPMRQYAYAVDPNGRTSTHFVEGVGADGAAVEIGFDDIDMRPAELEGLLGPLDTRAGRMLDVLETFRANRPDAARTVGIRYMRLVVQLEDRRISPPRLIELTRVEAP